MKKLTMVLSALCLCLICLSGLGESVDFSAYVVGGHYVFQGYMPDEHNYIADCWADHEGDVNDPLYLSWWRDGALYREIRYAWDDPRLNLAPKMDGTPMVVMESAEGLKLFDWGEAGLENERLLAEKYVDWTNCAGGFAVITEDEAGSWLEVFTEQGEREAKVTVPAGTNFAMRLCRLDGGEWVAVYYTKSKNDSHVTVMIDNGAVQWEKPTGTHTYTFLSDGQGGFFTLEFIGDSNYPPCEITQYDQQGNKLQKHILSGSNKVRVSVRIRYNGETGGYQITGRAVAGSKKIYNVYQMEVDAQFRLQNIDVREFRYEDDYNFGLYFTLDGKTFASNENKQGPGRVIVPFEALPKAKNPGVAIK